MYTLDTIDYAILHELTQDARKTIKELSEKVNLSAPAIATRIRRMRENETIVGYHAVLDYEKLGYEITALIQVAVPSELRESFQAYLQKKSCVLSCDHITGSYAVLLRAVFRGRKELSLFVHEMEKFGKTQTQMVLSSLLEPFSRISYEPDA